VKIVVYDNNIGQVITQDSFLAIIVHDRSAINFSPKAEVEDIFVIFAVWKDGLSASLGEIIQILRWAFHVFYC